MNIIRKLKNLDIAAWDVSNAGLPSIEPSQELDISNIAEPKLITMLTDGNLVLSATHVLIVEDPNIASPFEKTITSNEFGVATKLFSTDTSTATSVFNFDGTATQIWKDGDDLKFKDVTTGTKTLAQLAAGGGGGSDLATTLALGNSAGAFDIDMNGNDINGVNAINPLSPLTIGSDKTYPFVIDTDNSIIGSFYSGSSGSCAGLYMDSTTGIVEVISFAGDASYESIPGHTFPTLITYNGTFNAFEINDVCCAMIGLTPYYDIVMGGVPPAMLFGSISIGINGPQPPIVSGGGIFYTTTEEFFNGTGADNQVYALSVLPRSTGDLDNKVKVEVGGNGWTRTDTITGSNQYIYDPVAGTITFGTNGQGSAPPAASSNIFVKYISGSYLDGVQDLDLLLLHINMGGDIYVSWLTMQSDTAGVVAFLTGMGILVSYTTITGAYTAMGATSDYEINPAAFSGGYIISSGDLSVGSITAASAVNTPTIASDTAAMTINCDSKYMGQFSYVEFSPSHKAAVLFIGSYTGGVDYDGEISVCYASGDPMCDIRQAGLQLNGDSANPDVSIRLQSDDTQRVITLNTDTSSYTTSAITISSGGGIGLDNSSRIYYGNSYLSSGAGTNSWVWALPDKSGTVAMTSDIVAPTGLTGTTSDTFTIDNDNNGTPGGILYGGTASGDTNPRSIILANSSGDVTGSSDYGFVNVARRRTSIGINNYNTGTPIARLSINLEYNNLTPTSSEIDYYYNNAIVSKMDYKGDLYIGLQAGMNGAKFLASPLIAAQRTFTLPDASGTVALTSDLGSYLATAGGTMAGSINMNSAGGLTNATSVTSTSVTAGSYGFTGEATVLSSTHKAINFEGSPVIIETIASAGTGGAIWHYIVTRLQHTRTGTIMAVWDHDLTSVKFTETCTDDIGDTSDLTFDFTWSGLNLLFTASATWDAYTVKVIKIGL